MCSQRSSETIFKRSVSRNPTQSNETPGALRNGTTAAIGTVDRICSRGRRPLGSRIAQLGSIHSYAHRGSCTGRIVDLRIGYRCSAPKARQQRERLGYPDRLGSELLSSARRIAMRVRGFDLLSLRPRVSPNSISTHLEQPHVRPQSLSRHTLTRRSWNDTFRIVFV